MPIINCLICGKERNADSYDIRIGKAKFCSQKCAWKYSSSHPNGGNFKNGHKIYPKAVEILQKWVKENGAWSKGKKLPKRSNENHFAWKGNNAGYTAKHIWVYGIKGKPIICEHCGNQAKHWANIDHKYKRNINDYLSLCVSCHRKYDFKNRLVIANKKNILGQFVKNMK